MKKIRIRSVTIEVTNTCNWNCIHCYQDVYLTRKISVDDYDKLFHELRWLGVEEINFTGGEVFSRKDFINILEVARKKYIKVNILSNISLLNEDIIKELKELYINQIDCTIFSMETDIHNYMCGREDSDQLGKVIENIKLLRKYDIPVLIKMPIMKKNYNGIEYVKEFADENGCGFKVDCTIFPTIGGNTSVIDYNIDYTTLRENIKLYDKINGVSLEGSNAEKNENSYYCKALEEILCIDVDGNVFPCVNYRRTIGNIFEESLANILLSPLYRNIKGLRWGDVQSCLNCNEKKYCIPCVGLNYFINKDEKMPFKKICEKTECRRCLNEKVL